MDKINQSVFSDNHSLRSQVFREIEAAILNGEFLPGDALSELKLSEKLGVSRTPVREALGQLELEGLVRSFPNRGAVVVGISQKDIEDIFAIRMRIEGLAARWCAENITPEERDALRDIVDLQQFYLDKGEPLQVWHLDSRFHAGINDACRSGPLKHTLSGLHNYISKARRISMENAIRARESVEEHRGILNAVAERNADLAERLTVLHIENARNSFLHQIEP